MAATSYLYLLKSGESSYKIGISKYIPSIRIKGLQTGNPEDIEIICYFESEFINKLEKTLHRTFMLSHKRGEWFTLNKKDVNSFLSTCEDIEKTFKYLKTENTLWMS